VRSTTKRAVLALRRAEGHLSEPTEDRTRTFREFEPRRHRGSATKLVTYEVVWAVAVWGTFYGGLSIVTSSKGGWMRAVIYVCIYTDEQSAESPDDKASSCGR